MTSDRLALGWKIPDLGLARLVISPTASEVNGIVESGHKDAIHVMAGARLLPLGSQALKRCEALNRRVGILTEAPDPRGMAGCGRWVKYTLERFTKGARYDFVLPMGEMGVRWFRSNGYPAVAVFPFVYVTEAGDAGVTNTSSDLISLLYVGQFIQRKGLDILVRAFASVATEGANLQFLGDGPDKASVQNLAQQLGVDKRVVWLSKSEAPGVRLQMQKADVTLLPSRHDGWGAVVNESLMVGTPVICSTACGAAELIREQWLGSVFASGSVPELAKALRHWIELGPRKQKERDRIRAWSTSIQGPEVANYFVALMEHVYTKAKRPAPPWRVVEDLTRAADETTRP